MDTHAPLDPRIKFRLWYSILLHREADATPDPGEQQRCFLMRESDRVHLQALRLAGVNRAGTAKARALWTRARGLLSMGPDPELPAAAPSVCAWGHE